MDFPGYSFRQVLALHSWRHPTTEFESWVYETSELQSLLSEDLYMTLISTDYSSSGQTFALKPKLKEALNEVIKRDCYCHTLPNIADVSMGEHSHIFQSLDNMAKYGEPLWWLKLVQCKVCEEFWMIASEERINDVFIMKRLPLSISQKIIDESIWPEDFKKFETLLIIGKKTWSLMAVLKPS